MFTWSPDAEVSGGIKFLEAIGAPLPEARFIPTGGISAQLAEGYLALYDKFVADPAMLDSAEAWLIRDDAQDVERRMSSGVHLQFARQEYSALSALADSRSHLSNLQ